MTIKTLSKKSFEVEKFAQIKCMQNIAQFI